MKCVSKIFSYSPSVATSATTLHKSVSASAPLPQAALGRLPCAPPRDFCFATRRVPEELECASALVDAFSGSLAESEGSPEFLVFAAEAAASESPTPPSKCEASADFDEEGNDDAGEGWLLCATRALLVRVASCAAEASSPSPDWGSPQTAAEAEPREALVAQKESQQLSLASASRKRRISSCSSLQNEEASDPEAPLLSRCLFSLAKALVGALGEPCLRLLALRPMLRRTARRGLDEIAAEAGAALFNFKRVREAKRPKVEASECRLSRTLAALEAFAERMPFESFAEWKEQATALGLLPCCRSQHKEAWAEDASTRCVCGVCRARVEGGVSEALAWLVSREEAFSSLFELVRVLTAAPLPLQRTRRTKSSSRNNALRAASRAANSLLDGDVSLARSALLLAFRVCCAAPGGDDAAESAFRMRLAQKPSVITHLLLRSTGSGCDERFEAWQRVAASLLRVLKPLNAKDLFDHLRYVCIQPTKPFLPLDELRLRARDEMKPLRRQRGCERVSSAFSEKPPPIPKACKWPPLSGELSTESLLFQPSEEAVGWR